MLRKHHTTKKVSMVKNLTIKSIEAMTLKKLDFKSNTFEVLGVSIQFGRVINRDVKFSSVFDWKINQNKFIARGQLNSE